MPKYIKYSFFLLIILAIIRCSSIDEYTSTSLANQGILPLSASNSYLGTNLYLAKQAERSKSLYNFLELKGGPTAIQLIDENFKRPRLLMFYYKGQEAYSADLENQNDTYEWVVRGPYAITRTDFLKVSRISATSPGDPLFVVNGAFKRFKVDRELALATPTPLPTIVPTPRPTPKQTPKKIKTKAPVIQVTAEATKTAEIKSSIPDPSLTDFKPLNSDQQAIQMAKGFAERANNGDVIHTVKKDGESIIEISKWYTGSDKNVKEISNVNNIAEGKELVAGQRIRIPMTVLKNLKAMK